MNKIVFNNVTYKYTNYEGEQKIALKDLSLTINEGEFIAVVGSNGAGKSTLAKHINALLTPDEGSVAVNNLDTKDQKNLWNIRKAVGMVFQNPDNQIVATIIEDDVAFGPENLGIAPQEIRKRVDTALSIVEMTKYKNKASNMLSGGQKQRVAIAGVLALEPGIVVFDESTAMLDPKGRAEVIQVAKTLHESGKTVILITHFMDEAMLADRIVVMSDGKIVLNDKPEEIFTKSDILEELSLTIPPVVKLKKKLKEIGIDVPYSHDLDNIVEKLCQQL